LMHSDKILNVYPSGSAEASAAHTSSPLSIMMLYGHHNSWKIPNPRPAVLIFSSTGVYSVLLGGVWALLLRTTVMNTFFDLPSMANSAADSVSEPDWEFCLLWSRDAMCCRWCPHTVECEGFLWPFAWLVEDCERWQQGVLEAGWELETSQELAMVNLSSSGSCT
jgi:hypothetical protein